MRETMGPNYNFRYNVWYCATYGAVLLSSVSVSAKLCRRCGHGVAVVFFAGMVAGGQAMFALGCTHDEERSYWLSVAGRVVFGFGYESLVTANQGLLSDWLTQTDNTQYFWSLGTAYCVARLVAVVNYNVSPLGAPADAATLSLQHGMAWSWHRATDGHGVSTYRAVLIRHPATSMNIWARGCLPSTLRYR